MKAEILVGQYWMYDAGSTLIDEAMDVSKDAGGNFYTTGYFSSSAIFSPTTTLSSNGVADIFLMKTNSSGQLIWAVKAGGFGEDRGLSIETDASGNSYITGFYYGTATFSPQTLTSAGGQDIFIAKYNSSGILQWLVSAGGPGCDLSNAIAQDISGNVIITGQFKGTATFGTTTISSQINPQTGQPCNNIFIAKYDSNGNFIWVKHGASDKDCRGINIATDGTGNIFTTGIFSDTLTFDQTHNNNIYNGIYLIKMDSSGQEQWFKRAGGTLHNIAYGITTDMNQDVIITGEASGSLSFFGSPTYLLTSPYNYQVFLAKYKGVNGYLSWAISDGSDSEVSSQVVCADNSGNLFITGTFKCKFSEYADSLGQGTFNSIGYQDIFVTKYNTTGQRLWMRNFGGKYEDYIHGMVIANNRPVLAGSFKNALAVPSSYSSTTSTNHNPGYFYFPVNTNNIFCNDNNYDQFTPMLSYGNSDIFLIDAINLNRQPYDYYCRDASMAPCDRSYIGCCINMTGSEYCSGNSNNEACGSASLYAASNTSSNYSTIITCGPNFTYHWSTGATYRAIPVTSSGTYSVTVTTEDECFQSADTFDVIIHPFPQTPWISDNYGIGVNSPNPYSIMICADSVILTGSNTQGCSFQWSGPGITGNPNDSIITLYYGSSGGTYTFTLTDSHGCHKINWVNVDIQQPFPPIDPYLFNVSNTLVNNTIYVCSNEFVYIHAFDSISDPGHTYPCNPVLDPVMGQMIWSISPNVFYYGDCYGIYFYPGSSGFYQFDYTLIRHNQCDTDTFVAQISYYIQILPNPVINISISGNQYFCPGDSMELTACCASNYHWGTSGGAFIGDLYNDSITVLHPGYYWVSCSETNQYGCTATGSENLTVTNWPVPNITLNPSSGLICPGNHVTLYASGGISYEWYGPTGILPSNSSNIQVTVAGYYFCIVTFPDSCRVTSNTVEVKQYSTPLLEVFPSDVICPGDSVFLILITNAESNYYWLPPLYGNNLTQVITNPGTYSCQVVSCGITTTASSTIHEGQMEIIVSPDTAICYGDTAFLYVQNLIPGSSLVYFWLPSAGIISGGNTDHPVVSPSVSTTYIVYSQNELLCERTDTVVVTIRDMETGISNSQDVLCYGDCNGSAVATCTGTPPFQFYWSNNTNNSSVSGLCPGSYSVAITDSIGCTSSVSIIINEPAPITTAMQSVPTLGCDGNNCSGQLIVFPSGGTLPYTYHWWDNQTNDTLISLCAGDYYVTVYDSHNCFGIVTK